MQIDQEEEDSDYASMTAYSLNQLDLRYVPDFGEAMEDDWEAAAREDGVEDASPVPRGRVHHPEVSMTLRKSAMKRTPQRARSGGATTVGAEARSADRGKDDNGSRKLRSTDGRTMVPNTGEEPDERCQACKHDQPEARTPVAHPGLRRKKRHWVIHTITVTENERGLYPKRLVQINSILEKTNKVFYFITGEGVDQPPEGLFSCERDTGWLLVTQPLDREKKDQYLLRSHTVFENGMPAEEPMEIIINVMDQNDNRPVFTESVFRGSVAEMAKPGTSVMVISATDLDDSENVNNGIVGYSILNQEPKEPTDHVFTVNKETGVISVNASGLDRERVRMYTLTVLAADAKGEGLMTTATAEIKIKDINDHAPIFDPKKYIGIVPENEERFEVQRLIVSDGDEANTETSKAVYKIVKGNEGGFFEVTTDPVTNDGILTTAKGLDFEREEQHVLYIIVQNKVPFVHGLQTSTATVTVNVQDSNEAPVFDPPVLNVQVFEDLRFGQRIATIRGQDPDTKQNQKIRYIVGNDPAKWLAIDSESGTLTGKGNLDREDMRFVLNDTYTVEVLAVDNGVPCGTGMLTVVLHLLDVNDNGPEPDPRMFTVCTYNAEAQMLNIIDLDRPPNTFPFRAELTNESAATWDVHMNEKDEEQQAINSVP
ncbi:blastomere cadherin-like [Pleurodeles waltl]|uniref:blastomere cadherin-like n=1 Tax=Pleurodeles waltl TaxID=8319 RepID=UPI00370975C0